MSGQQFSRFQQQRKGGGPTHEELAALYGPLVFDIAVPILMDVAKTGLVLESDRFDYLREMLGPEMAAKVGGLKQQIRETVKEEHGGPFDGWVKHVARTEFGAGTDFAMEPEHGDQELNLICLVLSGQAGRVADIRALEKVMGKEIPSTKKAVGPELKGFMEKITEMEAGYDKSKAEAVAPWDQKSEPYSAYLKRKTSRETLMKTGQGQIKFLTRVYDRLHEWVNYKKDDDQPKGKKDQLLAQVARMMEQITGLLAEERDAAEKGEYGIAGDKKKDRLAVEVKVREIELEISRLAVSGQQDGKGEAGTSTARPGDGKPMGAGPKVDGDAEQAKAKASDVAAKIEAYRAEITRLEVEATHCEKKVTAKEAEAVKKSAEARSEADDEKAEVMLRDARLLRQGAKASAEMAENHRKEITELTVEIERLTKSVETPKAEAKKKAAKKKKAETSTSEPPVVETDDKASTTTVVVAEDKPKPNPQFEAVVAKLRTDMAAAIASGDEAAAEKAHARIHALGY